MLRYLMIINGRVQGVGFRYFAKLKALELSLTGYAKNLNSGEVIIEIQGGKEYLDKFISYIIKGNNFAKIDDINFKVLPLVCNEKNFKIKY
ncbi:acylphosphatase [Clostridium uliginosum]|uniref:Acylphosphatase n=1 Tax=Clostridium uliginosum TaxID=119641 RepID=A0A1I1PL37_9CLOT|nr:acylphosphatase [Clostridium uliginosum]SFD10589.1 acylphosphatase [Clostridium uliginosum]